MFQKNSVFRRIICNVYVCILSMQHVNKTPTCLQYYFLRELCIEQSNRKNIKMSKSKNDDELEISES